MRTLTEFVAPQLKNGFAKLQELATAGKTADELNAGMGEAFKYEGDKLKWFLFAIEVVNGKFDGLKRVLVHEFKEGEKVPSGAVQKETWHFVTEFFAQPQKAAPEAREGRGGRDGKGRGKGGKGGRGGRDGKPRGPRRDGEAGGQPARDPNKPIVKGKIIPVS
ncbi:MAG: hypothetical protein JNL01_07785 [Bdellovibrionales bacterium]|nr:hypothetical protein [Bdellovibrionales bacterium]